MTKSSYFNQLYHQKQSIKKSKKQDTEIRRFILYLSNLKFQIQLLGN